MPRVILDEYSCLSCELQFYTVNGDVDEGCFLVCPLCESEAKLVTTHNWTDDNEEPINY